MGTNMNRYLPLALICLLAGCSSLTTVKDTSGEPLYISHTYTQTEPKPTVIIAHGCDGLTTSSYNQWARLVHSWGYNTILNDSFSKRWVGDTCGNIGKVTANERANDMIEIAKFVKQQPWHKGKIAVIGFSHGGSTVLNLAAIKEQTEIAAVVAYYPGCFRSVVGRDISTFYIPAQMHIGLDDDWTAPGYCGDLTRFQGGGYLYFGATHAFDMPYPDHYYQGHHIKYDSKADKLAKERTKAFLAKELN